MSTIHLKDNSWHVVNPDFSQKDIFGRKPLPLEKNFVGKTNELLRILSSSTIGNLMTSEETEVLVWPNSFNEGYEELKDQYIFRATEKDGKSIDSITTGNVVGFIGIGSDGKGKSKVDIRIHSRFASSNDNDYFLYYMLEKTMSINQFNWDTSSSKDGPQVFDFLLFFFPRLLKEAMSQGMYKKYVYHEYNDANIRGVIDVNRHIRLNIPANGKIAYRTREFSYDNPVTQLIRHTIEFIRRKSFGKSVLHNDPDTEGYVQQIIQATPSYQAKEQQAVINDNLRPVVHPYYTKYAALQKLCLRILRHEKLSYGEANDNKIHGILIDAAWLWEEYVAKVLSEGENGLKHYTRNGKDYHLFIKGDKAFQQIIPDYCDEENHIVADAKYIPLHRSRELSADRAAPIYYKTIMYMYRFDTKVGFLFHPCSQEDATYVKTNKYLSHLSHLEIKEKTISCNYQIEGREDCHLHEVGMIIPQLEKVEEMVVEKVEEKKPAPKPVSFSKFKEDMGETEASFVTVIENII